ncbi:hypothetical protein HK102_003000 [Quaeritorhiza haematococci]|nr:hypothetical protein HK102_003000 [Quaeritorhiza haematococci]
MGAAVAAAATAAATAGINDGNVVVGCIKGANNGGMAGTEEAVDDMEADVDGLVCVVVDGFEIGVEWLRKGGVENSGENGNRPGYEIEGMCGKAKTWKGQCIKSQIGCSVCCQHRNVCGLGWQICD